MPGGPFDYKGKRDSSESHMIKKTMLLLVLLPLVAYGQKLLVVNDPIAASRRDNVQGNDALLFILPDVMAPSPTTDLALAAAFNGYVDDISIPANVDNAKNTAGGTDLPMDTTGFRGYGVAYNDSVLSGDIYVDASAAAGGNGRAAAPFRTIQAGLNAAAAGRGDTVVVLAGTYPETVIPGSNVVLTNFKKHTVRVSGNPSGTLYLAKVANVHNVTIQGIDFSPTRLWRSSGWSQGPYHIEVDGSSRITFRYCSIRRLTENIKEITSEFIRGVHVGTSEHVTFLGNYFKGWSHSLMFEAQESDTSFFLIKYNHLAEQSWCGIIFGTKAPSSHFHTPAVLVEGNLIENSWGEDGIQWQPDYRSGAACQKVPKHFKYLVRNNVFRDLLENAVDLKAVGHAMFENNYFYRIWGMNDGIYASPSRSSPGAITVGSADSSTNAIIRMNVFYDNAGTIGARMWSGWKLFHNTMVYNMRGANGPGTSNRANVTANANHTRHGVKNNIDVNSYIAVQSSAHGPTLDVDYNIYYTTKGLPRFSYYSRAWTKISGLPRWQAHWNSGVLGRDVHSMSKDPELSSVPAHPSGNHASYNFMPAGGSNVVDAAGPLTLATSGAAGTNLVVADAYYFRDAWGMSAFGVVGDSIVVAAQAPVGIKAIDYTTNAITLSGSRTWRTGAPVYLYKNGKKVDDIGAMQR